MPGSDRVLDRSDDPEAGAGAGLGTVGGSVEVAASPARAVLDEVTRQMALPVAPEARVFMHHLHERFGGALAGVLLYGSSLHDGDLTEGLVDIYAVVDSYRAAYGKRALAVANRVLAPNVFYLEDTAHEPPLRAKYAVMSLPHFEKACCDWFHSYVWARFAQPARLAWERDPSAGIRIRRAVTRAVVRFLEEAALAATGRAVGPDELWATGLRLAYAAELRAEKGRARLLVDVHDRSLRRLTAAAAPALEHVLQPTGDARYRVTANAGRRARARRRWSLRRWQGRALTILRLAKAAFTFDGGVDYLAWKIERHTGVAVSVTPALRRHPLLLGPWWLLRLLRQRIVR